MINSHDFQPRDFEPQASSPSLSQIQANNSKTKRERIANLKQEIAQARSLASLGEMRLNKWRNRIFK